MKVTHYCCNSIGFFQKKKIPCQGWMRRPSCFLVSNDFKKRLPGCCGRPVEKSKKELRWGNSDVFFFRRPISSSWPLHFGINKDNGFGSRKISIIILSIYDRPVRTTVFMDFPFTSI